MSAACSLPLPPFWPRSWSPQQARRVLELRQAGHSVRGIAAQLGLSTGAVQRILAAFLETGDR